MLRTTLQSLKATPRLFRVCLAPVRRHLILDLRHLARMTRLLVKNSKFYVNSFSCSFANRYSCDQLPNCISFNLYYERDPSQNPAAACPNPTSVTNIKCVRYGVQLNAATATNTGETRSKLLDSWKNQEIANTKQIPPLRL